jgi:hypothetical protein
MLICLRVRVHVRVLCRRVHARSDVRVWMWVCAPDHVSVHVRLCECVCVRAFLSVRLLVRVCARVRVQVHRCVHVPAVRVFKMHLPCQLAVHTLAQSQYLSAHILEITVSVSDDQHPCNPSSPPFILTCWVS